MCRLLYFLVNLVTNNCCTDLYMDLLHLSVTCGLQCTAVCLVTVLFVGSAAAQHKYSSRNVQAQAL